MSKCKWGHDHIETYCRDAFCGYRAEYPDTRSEARLIKRIEHYKALATKLQAELTVKEQAFELSTKETDQQYLRAERLQDKLIEADKLIEKLGNTLSIISMQMFDADTAPAELVRGSLKGRQKAAADAFQYILEWRDNK